MFGLEMTRPLGNFSENSSNFGSAILPLRIKASAPQTARLVGHMAGQWHPLPATVQWHAAVPLHSARTTLLCNDGRLPGRGSRRDLRRAGAGIAAAHFAFGPSSQL